VLGLHLFFYIALSYSLHLFLRMHTYSVHSLTGQYYDLYPPPPQLLLYLIGMQDLQMSAHSMPSVFLHVTQYDDYFLDTVCMLSCVHDMGPVIIICTDIRPYLTKFTIIATANVYSAITTVPSITVYYLLFMYILSAYETWQNPT
jgi:hypothetical protein